MTSLRFLPVHSSEKHLTSRTSCEYIPQPHPYLYSLILRHVLTAKAKTKVTTIHHHTKILELMNTISQNLTDPCQAQCIHMPSLTPIFGKTHDNKTTEDSIKLWLPSELLAGEWESWCLPDIPILEFHFCYTQANDSLAEIYHLH